MSACHPFRPVPGQCGPNRRGPLPAPPFDPRDYWATRKCVSRLSASLEAKLDKADVVDPGAEAEAGQAADAKSTYGELNRILGVASDARVLAESKADRATTLAGYGITDAATKTEIAAKADLVGGKVPAAQLPSYVDDVLEYDTVSAFPASGESSKIYVAKDTNLVYRWSGTQYVEISPSPVLDDTVTEESPNGVKSSGIWSWVKSLLPQWLTSDYAEPATVASVENKRDNTDLAVHDFTEWSGVPTGYYIKFDEEFKWTMRSSATDAMVGATVGSETDLRVMFGADDWSGGYEFTATRSTVPTFDTLAKKSELTAGLAAKRDNTDLAVYDLTEWTFAPALPDSYEIRYRDDLGGWGVYYNGSIAGTVKGSYDSLEISWDGNEWGGGYPFTATRSRIQTADTLATMNGVNAAIAESSVFIKTGGSEDDHPIRFSLNAPESTSFFDMRKTHLNHLTRISFDGSPNQIVFYDGTPASKDLLQILDGKANHEDLSAKRDLADNTCHKTEVYWTGDYGTETCLRFTFSNFEGYLSWNDGSGHFLFTKTGETYADFLCPEDWTGTAYVGIMGHAIESMATRHSVCTVGEKFVTSDVVDGKVSSAVSTKYTKPSGGIPASDLALTVQNSLDAADAAAPQATTYTKTETDAAIRVGASLGQMTNLGNGRYEYTGALEDASTKTYPREEA